MKKYKFTILKHTLVNGTSYYVCKVKKVYPLVWTREGIGLFLSNYSDYNERYVNDYGGSYWDQETKFKTRDLALSGINKYMQARDEEDGEQVVSVETEIIWR
jgi:hypothetical protein